MPYKIDNNSINYKGKIFKIVDYSLISYDEDGTPLVLVLPVEQNMVTDPYEIARLNNAVSINRSMLRSNRSYRNTLEDLPYSADVPRGQTFTQTPKLTLNGAFGNRVKLTLNNFPLFTSSNVKRFSIRFSTYSWTGSGYKWFAHRPDLYRDYNFSRINNVKYIYTSDMKEGILQIINLRGNPSPSYTYTVEITNL